MTYRIKNFEELNTSALRKDALTIAEVAYRTIDTDAVLRSKLSFDGNMLVVDGVSYDISQFDHLRVLGFGKASCRAVQVIESLLRSHITDGLAIDVHSGTCDILEVAQGTHPRPSPENVAATKRIVSMSEKRTDKDLFIVVVSGGGSSLLCWPMEECEQGARLYDAFEMVGAAINEMNVVRKHISSVKGGGLAALLYPATVIGLIFCDVPGDRFEDVASGPTYFDESTVKDAEEVLRRYNLTGYMLKETPKDKKIFEKVHNVPITSNTTALTAMSNEAARLGYQPVEVGTALYKTPLDLVHTMQEKLARKVAVIAGGEPRLAINRAHGEGGRCQYTVLQALTNIHPGEVIMALASDGHDNSDAAGAIGDEITVQKAHSLGLTPEEYLQSFDAYHFFKKTGDGVVTGLTDANVSDLFMMLRA